MEESKEEINEISVIASQMADEAIEQLKQDAEKEIHEVAVSPDTTVESYFAMSTKMYNKGLTRYKEGRLEDAYCFFIRVVGLVTEKLPYHPGHSQVHPRYRQFRSLAGQAVAMMERIREELHSKRYQFHLTQLTMERNVENYNLVEQRSIEDQRREQTETEPACGKHNDVDCPSEHSSHSDSTHKYSEDGLLKGKIEFRDDHFGKHHGDSKRVYPELDSHVDDYHDPSVNGYSNKYLDDNISGMDYQSFHSRERDSRPSRKNILQPPDPCTFSFETVSLRPGGHTPSSQPRTEGHDIPHDDHICYPKVQDAVSVTDIRSPSSPSRAPSGFFAPSVGIRNPGSMCYISAPLAIALRLEEFQRFVNFEANNSESESVRFLLTKLAQDMAACEHIGQRSVDLPYGFDRILRSIGLNVTVGESGDAQEAFSCIVEGLATELQAAFTPFDMKLDTWRVLPNGEKRNIPSVEERCLHVSIPQHRLEQPRDYLYGSERPLHHPLLRMLSNGSPFSVPLLHCINEYLNPSEPNGSEGDKFISRFEMTPQLLMVHLRRANSDTGSDVFCSDDLFVSSAKREPDVRYRLRAVISHVRLIDGANEEVGHYIAVMRYPDSKKCIICDDSSVSVADEKLDVATAPQQVYLAIYQRTSSNPS
eukprot:gb/GECG01003224.1/.p1 GENE.gb/GECG01003224.1/~~gb/GECG01003224.1/.p1  ORF type:complete len:648 (+),score=72.19 gb/GECG01003224.1/:1-1944(+)